MRNRVADRRDGGPACRLTEAEARTVRGSVDELDRDIGHLAEAQYRIAFPVARADAVAVEPHALLERPARCLDDAAFQLIDRAVGVDDETGVRGAPHAQQMHGFID